MLITFTCSYAEYMDILVQKKNFWIMEIKSTAIEIEAWKSNYIS